MTRRQLLRLLVANPLLSLFPLLSACQPNRRTSHWHGTLFNSPVEITFHGKTLSPESFLPEILRLESIFSLYEPDSSISQLNREGSLNHPPAELVDLLRACQDYHQKSQGLFDPTIQTYWKWLAEQHRIGHTPTIEERQLALQSVDFTRVEISASLIKLNGTQLTLNSVSQGFITDRITKFLKNHDITEALINLGEFRALGGPYEVHIRHPRIAHLTLGTLSLNNQALAVSSGSGHRLTASGQDNHIISPRNGTSPQPSQTFVILADNATDADAWATIAALTHQTKEKLTLPARIQLLKYN